MTLSARNRLEGKIEELQLGSVMAHVAVRVGENLIESVITRRSAEEMKVEGWRHCFSCNQIHRSDVGKEIVAPKAARLSRCFIPQAHE
jgi:molybdopterin-binding protein